MDFLSILEVFEGYSLPIIIISIVISVCTVIVERFFSKKISLVLLSYIPFILGIAIYSLYFLIFLSKEQAFSSDVIYQGVLCGALSTVYVVIVENILRGNFSKDLKLAAIRGNIRTLTVKNELSVSKKIKLLFEEDKEDEILKEDIVVILKESTTESEEELYAIAGIVIQAIKTLNSN